MHWRLAPLLLSPPDDAGGAGGGAGGEGSTEAAGAEAGSGGAAGSGTDAGAAAGGGKPAGADELATARARVAELEKAEQERMAAEKAANLAKRKAEGDILGLYDEAQQELTQAAARLAETEAKLAKLEQKETARIEAVAAANTTTIAKLAPEVQALVPDLDPDTLAARLPALQAMSDKLTGKPAGGRGGPAGGGGNGTEIPADAIRLAKDLGETADADFVEHIYKPYKARLEAAKKPAHLRHTPTA